MIDDGTTAKGQQTDCDDDWGMFLELLGDYIFIVDSRGAIIHANNVALARFRYSMDELAAMNIFDLYPPARTREAEDVYSQIIMGEKIICDIPLVARGGASIEVETRVTAGRWRGRDAIFSISRDVSAGKVIQYELRLAFEKLRSIIVSISAYVWSAVTDRGERFNYLFQSPVVESITGRSADYFIGGPDRWMSIVHPADAPEVEEMYGRLMKGGSQKEEIAYRIFFIDGSERWVRDSVLARGFGDGQVRLDGVITDITERRHALLALQESEERLKAILRSMKNMVFAFDRETRFTFYHAPSAGDLYIEPEVFLNRKHGEVMPPELDSLFQEAFDAAREGREMFFEYDLTVEGSPRRFACRLNPLAREGTFDGAVAVIEDITVMKELTDSVEREREMRGWITGNIGEGFVLTGPEGRILESNGVFNGMTGKSGGEIRGTFLGDFLVFAKNEESWAALIKNALEMDEPAPMRCRIKTPSGPNIPAEVRSCRCDADDSGVSRLAFLLVRI